MEKKKRQLVMQRINKHSLRCLWLNKAKYEPHPDLQWHTIKLTNPLKVVVASHSTLLIRRLLIPSRGRALFLQPSRRLNSSNTAA